MKNGICALFLCLLSSAALSPALAASSPERIDTRSLLARLGDVNGMAKFRNYTSHLVSSTDPTGGNEDWGHYVRKENGSAVLADLEGPGAVVRIWSANADVAGTLRIYIDDQTVPVIETQFADFFKGGVSPFAKPVVTESSGGFISYFPIPYAKHCKILLDHPTDQLYYQVGFISFAPGTSVTSFALPLDQKTERAL